MSEAFPLLFPLDRFYARQEIALPEARRLTANEVPQPYRQLLCGEHDMTPTLEAFHKDRIHLRVLERWQEGEALWRLVALELVDIGRPVEFGAIVIHLSLFPKDAAEVVLEGHCPLGSILSIHHIYHESRPYGFVSVQSDSVINNALGLQGAQTLYGRRNVLKTLDGSAIADILEILPPEELLYS